jgi:hypothetical protein
MTQKHYPGSNGNKIVTADFGKEGAAFCSNFTDTWAISISDFASMSWVEPNTDYAIEAAHFTSRTDNPLEPASQAAQLTFSEWAAVLALLSSKRSRLFTVSETQTGRSKKRMLEAIKQGRPEAEPWASWLTSDNKISSDVVDGKGDWKTDDKLSAQRLAFYLREAHGHVAILRTEPLKSKSYSPAEVWGQQIRSEQNTMLINAGHSTVEQLDGMKRWADGNYQALLEEYLKANLSESEYLQLYYTVDHKIEERKTVLAPMGLTKGENKKSDNPVMRHDWTKKNNPQILRSVYTCVIDINGKVRKKFGSAADEDITAGLVVDKLLKMHGDRAGANAGSTARAYVYQYGFPAFLRNMLWLNGIQSHVNCQNIATYVAEGDITLQQKSVALKDMKALVKKLVRLLVELHSS